MNKKGESIVYCLRNHKITFTTRQPPMRIETLANTILNQMPGMSKEK